MAPYWSTPDQLRTSAALLSALVRRLEGADGATIGLRELGNGRAAIDDLARVRPHELELLSDREIQEAAVLIDGIDSAYRVTTDGVGAGMLGLHLPKERQGALLAALQEETARLRAAGSVIRIPALDS
ncbi:MAG TPA: hypothetical protein VND45_05300 [Thermoanaerobaculia bacterium]|nr:hypothetical protein [Thermoanaerobaculia bacterium]